MARAAEQNLGKLAVNEVTEVDEAIQSAVEYAGPDALVIVTNNYSLGAIGPLPPCGVVAAAPTISLPTPTDAVAAAHRHPPCRLLGRRARAAPPPRARRPPGCDERDASGWFSTNAPGLLAAPAGFPIPDPGACRRPNRPGSPRAARAPASSAASSATPTSSTS